MELLIDYYLAKAGLSHIRGTNLVLSRVKSCYRFHKFCCSDCSSCSIENNKLNGIIIRCALILNSSIILRPTVRHSQPRHRVCVGATVNLSGSRRNCRRMLVWCKLLWRASSESCFNVSLIITKVKGNI